MVEFGGHLALGGPLGEARQHLGQGAVGDRGRGRHAGHLLGRLAAAQALDDAGRRHQLGATEPLAGESPVAGPAHVLGLQGDAPQPGNGRGGRLLLLASAVGDDDPAVDAGG